MLFRSPLIETLSAISEKEFLSHPELSIKINTPYEGLTLFNSSDIIHKLSHRELHIKFWILKTKKAPQNAIAWSDIVSYPVPTAIQRFINNFQI